MFEPTNTGMNLCQIFVYGTLKRGQCRHHLWPHEPVTISEAWIRGSLYGRADYPALRTGNDRVQGELWQFAETHLSDTLSTLDEIEGTNQPGSPDLYSRKSVETYDLTGKCLGPSYCYFYVRDPEQDGFHRIFKGSHKSADSANNWVADEHSSIPLNETDSRESDFICWPESS